MINIGICDDNKEDIDVIQKFVTEYMSNKKILFRMNIYISGETLLEANNKLDIVFLDIVMNGINGIQAGINLKNVNRDTKIIYITSFSEYWKQAVNNVHAFAYLEKPIVMSDISRQMDSVLYSLEKEDRKTVSFEVLKVDSYKTDVEYTNFDVNDIYYFEYVGRKIMLKTKDREYFFIGQMKDVIKKMESYKFACCHQSYMVNLKYVKKIKGYDLYLADDSKLPVSQKKSASFREKMNSFLQNSI